MNEHYDGTQLLSKKDINGKRPEIFMVSNNRSSGKTTFFARMLVKRFKEGKGKFALLHRYQYELDDVSDKFFKDINTLFFRGDIMKHKKLAGGIFRELFLNDVSCGYALCLNSAEAVKKYSHFFSDVQRIFMDEFQSETNHYVGNEIQKFISIHTSIGRGQGQASRYVPVYMCSNPVTILNPYYTALGISTRLTKNTKFLRGDGFVLEQGFNEYASTAQKLSLFMRAFGKDSYVAHASESIYLNDSDAFIEKLSGKCSYVCTLLSNGKSYSIREYVDLGYVYCDERVDETFPIKLTCTTDDHQPNYVMIHHYSNFIGRMRLLFEEGAFRFRNLACKEVIINLLSY